jgi:F-box protein 6
MDLSRLPYEILVHVFTFVDCRTQVFSCRFVCKLWRDIVQNESLRKRAIMINKNISNSPYSRLPWFAYYACEMEAFHTNLLKNTYGKDKFSHWTITENGGNRWVIELPFQGCSSLPDEALLENKIPETEEVGCFATSYAMCKKHQLIKLKDHKVSSKLLDEVKPTIEISEWYAPRFDCASRYALKVDLLNSKLKSVKSETFTAEMEAWTDGVWKKAIIIIRDYCVGVRYIRFEHSGKDAQFWAGHYGPKMTLGSVRLHLPIEKA